MTRHHGRPTLLTTVTRVSYEVDPHSKVPAYQQLASLLRADIRAGVYAPRQPIPSLTQLTGDTGLATGTVRHAIQVLEGEGLVYTVSGRGTFVSPRS
jgi:DNA-binding GntR family transcriptional regulator